MTIARVFPPAAAAKQYGAHYYNHADRKNIILELLQSETDLPSAAGGDEDAAD